MSRGCSRFVRFAKSILAYVLLTGVLWAGELAPRDRAPNVIVLLADDLGYGELGCQGNSEIPTPHIDSLAKNGVRFTSAYVTGPNCSPSRAGLLTGRTPTRFGYEFNPIGEKNELPGYGMPTSEITLAEALHDAGYTTGLIGKWHQGGAPSYHPFRHGFDEFFGFTHEGHYYVPPPWRGVTSLLRRKALPNAMKGLWSGKKGLNFTDHMGHDEPDYDANNPIIRGGQPVVESKYLTDALTREAIDFIDRHDDKPFFLYLAYNAVHSPLQATDESLAKFSHLNDLQRRIFAAMLSSMDDSVGQVLEQLRKSGLEQNTLVFFLSDNGGPTRELTSSNLPLRGEKGQMYEGGIRVPFLWQWPGKIPAGQVYAKPVSSMDLFATATAAALVNPPKQVEGVDLVPFLNGTKSDAPHETLFWRQGNRAALRHQEWKLVKMRDAAGSERTNWELYDLSRDASETTDLSTTYPERRAELVRRWESMNREMREPLFPQ